MNKSVFSSIIILLSVVSCALGEGKVSSGEGAKDMILVYAEEPSGDDSTRLKLDGYQLVWEKGDNITVVGNKATTFTITGGAGTASGTMDGDISAAGAGPYYAVVPKDTNATVTPDAVTFLIPQKKGAYKNNIASSTAPIAGKVVDGAVRFHNLFGLLKLTITSSQSVTIKKIAVHDLGGNMLWGTCTIPIVADTLAYDKISLSGGDNTINMVWNSPATFSSTARSCYFAVPPGSLDRGFSVVMYEYDSTKEDGVGRAYTFFQKVTSPLPVAKRSVIIEMDNLAIIEMSESDDVKERGYYKTLFINAGCRLSNNYSTSTFKWLTTLGMADDYEYFAGDSVASVIARQASVINKNSNDVNGVLLYPDGEPRFRMVYCNGGKSSYHGKTLYQDGRRRFHDFYFNGGSYVGTCAGGFLARSQYSGANCYDNPDTTKNHAFGIWPGTMSSSGMPKNNTYFPTIYTAQSIEMDFGQFHKGDTIEQVRHHGGFYIDESSSANYLVSHDILMKYQYTQKNLSDTTSYTEYNRNNYMIFNLGKTASRAGKVSMIAYKASEKTGRAVLCGSHPERVSSGSNLALMETMVRYALEGTAPADIKGELEFGQTRLMNKSTSDNDPSHTGIGDKQYHHFTFTTTADAEEFKLFLYSTSSKDLHLALRKDDLAWRSEADYVLCTGGANKMLNIKKLPAGTWYVSVYCPITVSAEAKTGSNNLAYIEYSGRTDVLNGVPYSICITKN